MKTMKKYFETLITMKYSCLFLVLVLIPKFVFAQKSFSDDFKYIATYELNHQSDSTDEGSVKSESMVLYLGDKVSRFSSLGAIVGDSLMETRDRSDKSRAAFAKLRSQIPKTEFAYYVIKGVPERNLSYTEDFGKDNFRYVEDLDLFEWEILTETQEIMGYQCQKATTRFSGREYTAWFTSEIPIPDGPYKFNGLPGLIVEISDKQNHYSFVLTEFKILKDPVPFQFLTKDYISASKEKVLDVIEKHNLNPFAAMERQGITLGFQPGQREKMLKEHREEMRLKNNPIELE